MGTFLSHSSVYESSSHFWMRYASGGGFFNLRKAPLDGRRLVLKTRESARIGVRFVCLPPSDRWVSGLNHRSAKPAAHKARRFESCPVRQVSLYALRGGPHGGLITHWPGFDSRQSTQLPDASQVNPTASYSGGSGS